MLGAAPAPGAFSYRPLAVGDVPLRSRAGASALVSIRGTDRCFCAGSPQTRYKEGSPQDAIPVPGTNPAASRTFGCKAALVVTQPMISAPRQFVQSKREPQQEPRLVHAFVEIK
jgi:hypothetical protein